MVADEQTQLEAESTSTIKGDDAFMALTHGLKTFPMVT